VVVVNFWATWCAPCVAELPSLARLRDRLHIDLVAVNFQENAVRIGSFLDQLNMALQVVRDHDGTLRAAWHVDVFPSTFVVDRDGRIAFVASGEVDWDDPAIQAMIDRLKTARPGRQVAFLSTCARLFLHTIAANPND